MSTATKTRSRVKPARTIRVMVPPSDNGAAVVRITVGRLPADYLVEPIPSEIGGRAFRLSKVGPDADGEVYHVLLTGDPRQDACGCKGFARHSHCKHRAGLAALCQAGRL
jgi:hypothetical protein